MNDAVNNKLDANDAKVESLAAAMRALEVRVGKQDQKLLDVTAARDKAVADLSAQTAENTALKAELAALPHDTTALEARLDAQSAKIDAVIAGLNAIDAEAVPATPAPEPEPAPAPVDPGAPTGTEVQI